LGFLRGVEVVFVDEENGGIAKGKGNGKEKRNEKYTMAESGAHQLKSGSEGRRDFVQGSGARSLLPVPCQYADSPSCRPMKTFLALWMLTW